MRAGIRKVVEEAIHIDWERRQPVRTAPNRPAIKTGNDPFKRFMKLSSRLGAAELPPNEFEEIVQLLGGYLSTRGFLVASAGSTNSRSALPHQLI